MTAATRQRRMMGGRNLSTVIATRCRAHRPRRRRSISKPMRHIPIIAILLLWRATLIDGQFWKWNATDQRAYYTVTQGPSSLPSDAPSDLPTSAPVDYPTLPPVSGIDYADDDDSTSTEPSENKASAAPSSKPTDQPAGIAEVPGGSIPIPTPIHSSSVPSQIPTFAPLPTAPPAGVQEVGEPVPIVPEAPPSRQPSPLPTAPPAGVQEVGKPVPVVPGAPPSRQPSRQPTDQPAGVQQVESPKPTEEPSSGPTSSPSNVPTPAPNMSPTGQPSPEPSPRPSRRPTYFPSQGPTRSPSRPPTVPPSDRPSRRPSLQPTSRPTTAAPTTVTPRPTVTRSPTNSPSLKPSRVPTRRPTMRPTVSPSLVPTPVPTEVPSAAPSLEIQSSFVNVVMVLSRTPGILEGRQAIQYESATAFHIRQNILNQGLRPPLLDLNVDTNVVEQQLVRFEADAVDDRRGLRASRWLQELLPLRLVVDVQVDYRSVASNYSASAWIGDSFNSVEKRDVYLSSLRVKGGVFDSVDAVELLVDGNVPNEEPRPSSPPPDNSTWVILGATLGVGSLVALCLGAFFGYKRYRTRASAAGPTKQVDDRVRQPDNVVLAPTIESQAQAKPAISTEILVERQDDVSTLGDPVGVGGMNTSNEVERDERTASVAEDFDYARLLRMNCGGWTDDSREFSSSEGRNRMMSGDMSIPVSRVSSSQSGYSKTGTGVMAASLFADDASFEQQFAFEDDVEEEKFDVEVPPGKLGMVIDTPDGGVPVVHALKSESILFDKVRVGDKLISVDEEDVTNMTALQVSKLISVKSDQARQLAFVRNRALADMLVDR